MRIGIDARFLTHPQPGGFKTYTTSLITALAELDSPDEYFLYLDRQPQTSLPARSNFVYRVIPGEAPLVGMIWREQVSLARQAARDRLDLFHAPCLTAPLALNCPLVVTLHDMIWRFPNQYSRQKRPGARRLLMEGYYRLIPEWAARRAARIVTVSQAARDSIVEQLRLPTERIQVTYEAAGSRFHRVEDAEALEEMRRRYGLAQPYILAIGSADPRKNIAALIQAYADLPSDLRTQYELVIAWNHASLVSEVAGLVAALGVGERVRFVRQVSNADLVLLYSAASLFVFPSLYEGFGLPLLEAMSCGAPVIAADNSSIPEVAGDAAVLVPAQDARAITQAMTVVLSDADLRAGLAAKGLERARQFSWKSCARQTMAAYYQAAEGGQAKTVPA